MATFTQDEYQIRSIDTVHINPSLLEGEINYTSIIGAHRAVRLDRYAPILLSPPVISGPETIPGRLICFPGVWDAAPTPAYEFQWLSDGNPLAGQTLSYLDTESYMSDTEITCVVTATNTSGSEGATSNGITVSIIEPIIHHQFEHYALSGLNQTDRQNMMVFRGAVATGISHEDRFDTMGMTVLPITGMWRENRFDMMSNLALATTGLGQPDTQLMHHTEGYGVQFARFDKNLTIVNPGAETGDLTGWTQDPNAPTGVMEIDNVNAHTGSNSFRGPSGTPFLTDYFQDIALDPADYADLDVGDCAVDLQYYDTRVGNYDYCHMYYEALDGSDVVLESFAVAGNTLQPPIGSWEHRIIGGQDLPSGTRAIRIHIVFENQIFGGIDTRIDDITLDLYKYVIVT